MFRQMFEEKYMRFPGGLTKAVTFSYDDGVEADKRLSSILIKNGLKGTFNLNSKLFEAREWHNRMDEEQTYNLFKDSPHEVALHGARHIFLDKVPIAEAVNEVVQNRKYLEEKFNRIVCGMAYAYNGYNEQVLSVLPSLGVEYARTTNDAFAFGIPQNFLLWNPTVHHRRPEFAGLAEKFFAAAPEKEFKNREPLLFYLWGHAYEFDDDNNWELIENFAANIKEQGGVWAATNMEICQYVKAYRSLKFSLDGERVYNPSALCVWLDLRGKTYKIPPAATISFDKEF